MGYKVPTVLNNFNVYANGTKFVGVGAEITLPNFEAMTETIDGAGIAGEIEEAVEGAFGSLETEVSFNNISQQYFDLVAATGLVTYRASMQVLNTGTQMNDFVPIAINISGKVKNFDMGNMKKGGKGEPKIVREITYIRILIDGKNVLELDKYNMIYKVNGVDKLAKIRSQI